MTTAVLDRPGGEGGTRGDQVSRTATQIFIEGATLIHRMQDRARSRTGPAGYEYRTSCGGLIGSTLMAVLTTRPVTCTACVVIGCPDVTLPDPLI